MACGGGPWRKGLLKSPRSLTGLVHRDLSRPAQHVKEIPSSAPGDTRPTQHQGHGSRQTQGGWSEQGTETASSLL